MSLFSGRQRLVIAVDFGTTFSGVAYAFIDDKEKFEVISEWPGGANSTTDKVPTEILYLDQDQVSGAVRLSPNGERRHQWGHGIHLRGRTDMESLKWFKLLLHDRNPFARSEIYGNSSRKTDSSPSAFVSWMPQNIESMFASLILTLPDSSSSENLSTQTRLTADLEERVTRTTPAARTAVLLTKMKLPPVEVVTDYLRSLREHAISVIERRFHSEFIQRTKTKYVLTVPAVWSDSAKALTVQAARNAGFGKHEVDFNLIGEPEAAAAYSLQAIENEIIKEGDTFVVCDAGGGTVDLVSYKIVQLNPLSISEVVGGSGGLCGSTFVNEKFDEHIRNILGDDTINKMKPVARNEMMRQWEDKVKFKFVDAEDIESYDLYIPGVPDNEEKGLEAGFLSLTGAAVKSIFDPTVDRIVDLVDEQIRKVRDKGQKVSAIILVGGFGSSGYLRKRLSENLFNGRKVRVIQPMNAWTAIVRHPIKTMFLPCPPHQFFFLALTSIFFRQARGALICGLNGSFVKDQIARRHYGKAVRKDYVPGKGWKKYRKWDATEEKWVVSNQMRWFAEKGMVIEEDKTVSIRLSQMLLEDSSRIIRSTLRACNKDDRPSWNDPDAVFTVCTLKSDISRLPLKTFEKRMNSEGVKYWKVHYSVEMKVSSGMITFSMNFEGKNYGSVDATFY
ncbi:hypothetical protein RUND412_000413 [Rhizina undulata]